MIDVVIVEDEMLVRLGMKLCLEEIGAEMRVTSFSSAEEALLYFDQGTADVLVTDIRLTGINGLELIERLKARGSTITTVVLSCYEDFSYARRAMELGVDKYILKHEVSEEELPQMILEVHRKRTRQESPVTERRMEGLLPEDGDLRYRVALVKLRGSHEPRCAGPETANLELLTEILQEILNHGALGTCFLRHGAEVFCILRFSKDSTEEAMYQKICDFYHNAQKSVGNFFNKNLYLTVSSPFEDLGQVRQEFSALEQAAALLFYSEESRLIWAGDWESGGEVDFDFIDAGAFLQEWMEKSKAALEEYLAQSAKLQTPVEQVKLRIVKYVHDMTGFLVRYYSLDPARLFSREECPNYINVSGFESAECLGLWLWEVLRRIRDYLNEKDRAVQKIQGYLEEHCTGDLTLQNVADQFHMSKPYFCQYFKKHTGATFTWYLNRLRIEKAKPLLKEDLLSVEEIAARVGFQNPNYFFRVFKKITGQTIGEFRKI